MSNQVINIGSMPNDKSGDPIRTAFNKINTNFDELYTNIENLVPSQTGNNGKILSTDGTSLAWIVATTGGAGSTNIQEIPSQIGNTGKILGTNGTALVWVTDNTGTTLPNQTGNTGKILGTDGTSLVWVTDNTGTTLPTQVGNTGKVLSTDGIILRWISMTSNGISLPTNTLGWLYNDGNGVLSWTTPSTGGSITGTEVAIGYSAGQLAQGLNAIAIGASAGSNYQGDNSIALGNGAGYDTQNSYSIAMGTSSGNITQGMLCISIGMSSGYNSQGSYSIAIGSGSGRVSQGIHSIAVGTNSALTAQGSHSIAIGASAGSSYQGINAIAIGRNAGVNNQSANSIILNATGSVLDSDGVNRFYVSPIRNATGANGILQYNSSTSEISYSNEITVNSNIWAFGSTGALTVPGIITRPLDDTLILVSGGSTGNSASISIDGEFGRLLLRTSDSVGSKTWEFGLDGSLTLPSGYPLKFGNGNSTIQAGQGFHINSEEGISLESVNVTDPGNPISYGWYFGTDGGLTLPDTTVQYTAWRGLENAGNQSLGGRLYLNGKKVTDGPYEANSIEMGAGVALSAVRSIGGPTSGILIQTGAGNTVEHTWQFGYDGKLTLPNAGKISNGVDTAQVGSTRTITTDSNGGTGAGIPNEVDVAYDNTIIPVYYYSGGGNPVFTDSTITFANGDVRTITSIVATGGYINIVYSGVATASGPEFPITLKTGNYAATVMAPQWTFGTDGNLTLPTDGAIKNSNGSLFNGSNSPVPISSKGASGDKLGMLAFDSAYIYYCVTDYVDGTADIWNRTAQTNGTW